MCYIWPSYIIPPNWLNKVKAENFFLSSIRAWNLWLDFICFKAIILFSYGLAKKGTKLVKRQIWIQWEWNLDEFCYYVLQYSIDYAALVDIYTAVG